MQTMYQSATDPLLSSASEPSSASTLPLAKRSSMKTLRVVLITALVTAVLTATVTVLAMNGAKHALPLSPKMVGKNHLAQMADDGVHELAQEIDESAVSAFTSWSYVQTEFTAVAGSSYFQTGDKVAIRSAYGGLLYTDASLGDSVRAYSVFKGDGSLWTVSVIGTPNALTFYQFTNVATGGYLRFDYDRALVVTSTVSNYYYGSFQIPAATYSTSSDIGSINRQAYVKMISYLGVCMSAWTSNEIDSCYDFSIFASQNACAWSGALVSFESFTSF